MCDYSLQGLPNRLAVEGEKLVTHRFPTGSIGMASSVDIACRNCPQPETIARRSWWSTVKRWLTMLEFQGLPAVCIPPGTRLLMSRIPDTLRNEFALGAVEDVTFVEVSAEPFAYRDALRFANGRQILLQSLREDVMFVVVATCLDESGTGQSPETQTRPRPDQEVGRQPPAVVPISAGE